MDGVLIVDKPSGPTSHDVVACVRRATGWAKIGHTGTLDPLATGVLPLVVGRATRLAQFLSASDKLYEADIRLGWATDTYDAEGTRIEIMRSEGPEVRRFEGQTLGPSDPRTFGPSDLDRLLDRFRGSYLQAAPAFSAKKVGGVRAYTLARNGDATISRSCPVTVYEIACIAHTEDHIRLRVRCSAGFYVRTFAHELGMALGLGAHLCALRRLRSGEFDAADAVPLDEIVGAGDAAARRVVPLERLLAWMPAVVATRTGVTRTLHGNELRAEDLAGLPEPTSSWVRVMDEQGALLAIAEPSEKGAILHPRVVVR